MTPPPIPMTDENLFVLFVIVRGHDAAMAWWNARNVQAMPSAKGRR